MTKSFGDNPGDLDLPAGPHDIGSGWVISLREWHPHCTMDPLTVELEGVLRQGDAAYTLRAGFAGAVPSPPELPRYLDLGDGRGVIVTRWRLELAEAEVFTARVAGRLIRNTEEDDGTPRSTTDAE